MLNSLFSRNKEKTQNPINDEKLKYQILSDFISNFVDEQANNAKITKVNNILQEYNVFFGGKYINAISKNISNATIELYISFEYIVDFLIKISDCNKNNNNNKLLEELTYSLNLESKYNSSKPKSVYEINYINETTNRNITIYVVNDDDIIDKIINTKNEEDKKWYEYKEGNITASQKLELFKASHPLSVSYETFKNMNTSEDYLFEDIIIEIIKYIPSYISLSDISDELLDADIIVNSIYQNHIYNYPAIWFLFLIEMKNYHTYNVLSYVYDNIMKRTKPNTVINLNNIITKIYINSLLYTYEISLNLELDNTIEFKINSQIDQITDEKKNNIRKLLLFYYKYNIFKFPYKYNFQKYIYDYGLTTVISPLKVIISRNLPTLDEAINSLYENECNFNDIINSIEDISIDDLKTSLNNKENILIIGRDKKNGILISKENLDRIVLESNLQTWLINCNELDNNDKLLLSVYIKITITSGDYYISYGDMFTLFNSNTQIYYIVDTKNMLNNTFKFEYFNNNMTVAEINNARRTLCAKRDVSIISTFEQLSTKAIHITEQDYESFSKITDRELNLSDIFDKKLSINVNERLSSQLSKRPKKGGKKLFKGF